MKLISQTSINNDVSIHYLDSHPDSDFSLTPLLICPGLSETAEEYQDLLEYLIPRRCIVLSFRGRGQSGTPLTGYDLKEHVADIESVVKSTGINHFHLYAFSRGVSYALEYTRLHPEQIGKLMILDYPPEHKAMPMDWPKDYIENYLVPFNRLSHIRPEAVMGIQRESVQRSIKFSSEKPVLVMRGLLEGSLISSEELEEYKEQFTNLHIAELKNSGHDFRSTEKSKLYEIIKEFAE